MALVRQLEFTKKPLHLLLLSLLESKLLLLTASGFRFCWKHAYSNGLQAEFDLCSMQMRSHCRLEYIQKGIIHGHNRRI